MIQINALGVGRIDHLPNCRYDLIEGDGIEFNRRESQRKHLLKAEGVLDLFYLVVFARNQLGGPLGLVTSRHDQPKKPVTLGLMLQKRSAATQSLVVRMGRDCQDSHCSLKGIRPQKPSGNSCVYNQARTGVL